MDEISEELWERIREKRRTAAAQHRLTFPARAMRGLLGQWAYFMAEDSKVRPRYYYMCGLTYLGHVLATRLRLDIGKGKITTRPQLYTLIVGPPDDGKSTAIRNTGDFFQLLPEDISRGNGRGLIPLKGLRPWCKSRVVAILPDRHTG